MFNQRRVLSAVLAMTTVTVVVAAAQPAQAAPQPGLSAAYSARAVAIGTRWNLVLTVANSDTPAAVPFSFGVSLPSGITSPAAATSTCTGATITTASPGTYAVVGTIAATQPTCTVTVPVTSTTEANYATCADDITGLVGLTEPARCASIYFAAPNAS
ncbi:hypothetical protein [Actinokineospora globicatena]|uniref:DUF7933 domain-containing protein n=1 Tax=Actinokineospora globicatena TaxID=103729 RepID=UPI0020A28CB6|nr:hypothetical protein [Actinokineospora globicatena]MCP2304470.1 hypothetical protein [Actinokineospora globicatena]GLW78164.1 hypothetical protein Aglo01_26460 [Actinokineospora globicatena]GLW85170.1 hypothetical protein Aglo02_28100 [Actinokineospora globicatena]